MEISMSADELLEQAIALGFLINEVGAGNTNSRALVMVQSVYPGGGKMAEAVLELGRELLLRVPQEQSKGLLTEVRPILDHGVLLKTTVVVRVDEVDGEFMSQFRTRWREGDFDKQHWRLKKQEAGFDSKINEEINALPEVAGMLSIVAGASVHLEEQEVNLARKRAELRVERQHFREPYQYVSGGREV
jgi:hypothetical protein